MRENKHENDDILKGLFSRLPKEELSAGFRETIMRQVMAEAVRRKKRNERFGLLMAILASTAIIALLVVSFIYLKIPAFDRDLLRIDWQVPDVLSMPFYLYIGFLCLILLGGDYLFRRVYKKHHGGEL